MQSEEPQKTGNFLQNLAKGLDISKPVLNGIFGNFLAETDNGLAIQAGFYRNGQNVDLSKLKQGEHYSQFHSKVCVLVHGLACDEAYWDFTTEGSEEKTNYGKFLARDLDFTPFYFRYNSGLHISSNGQTFAKFLQQLVQEYPIPIKDLVIVAHSMGGLVSRSACYYAEQEKFSWLQGLRKMILIGSPHLGAPLEKFGNIVTNVLEKIPVSYTKSIGNVINLRSQGIKDLRFGNIIDEDWKDTEEDALLQNTRTDIPIYPDTEYYVISGTITKNPEHIFSKWFGDAMVRQGSALGKTSDGKDILLIQENNHKEFASIGHIALGHSLEVYEQVLQWCKPGLSETTETYHSDLVDKAEGEIVLSKQELHGLTELVETAIAGGAKTVEDIQLDVLKQPYQILKKVIPIPGLIEQIEKLNQKSITGTHKIIQEVNKKVSQIAKERLQK
ncbi:MAG: alpha/beta hydrolase [Spirochaetota bacterium]